MAATWTEMFPPSPTWTEADMKDQYGRVFLVTGGTAGIGYETAKMIYHLNGTIYITSRSESSASKATEPIKSSSPHPSQTIPSGRGTISYVQLNLSDLSTIKGSAEEFLRREKRLDVIIHNAGVMLPADPEEKTEQGYHLQLGINVLAPFLLQHFLTPLLLSTASLPDTRSFSTRVIWVSSSGHRASPVPDGVSWDDLDLLQASKTGLKKEVERYGQSKAMGVMLAYEFARRYHEHGKGILSFSLHPGALKTGLQDNLPRWFNAIFGWLRHDARMGALTECWAGIREVNVESGEGGMPGDGKVGKNGGYVVPWGRWGDGHESVMKGLMERRTGERLWGVLEKMVGDYM
ncbi:related to light induced alcohol dehydrogenase Bli-4 [Phialocephala subalpina]|uniref:Related to light induced alcohol dehydrogenase Bli-4 n=1 Tax=Phialocephala subalpina TaxID=576137 RepID=A0A1L7XNN7_9HELO|nr:related to light induced alcohol dehydrogenase Bli-4 [Phialocephala subalpina]